MNCNFTCGYGTIITIFALLAFVLININNNFDIVYAQTTTTIPNFNIAAVGDWGCNSNTDKTVNSIKTQSPDLILGLGDYSYESSADCWLDTIDPIYNTDAGSTDNHMQIAIGNHENSESEDLSTYLQKFTLTRQFGQVYSFNFHNVHFLSMATEISYSSGSSQNVFVKNDLAAAAANPNIDWIIVYFHKPMYSSPSSCSSCSGESSLRDIYHPIFDQYGVDIVLEGHTHDYQRSFPIKFNSNSKSNPTITDTNRNNYIDPAGEIHAIVGTGGVNFHSLSSQKSFIAFQQSNRFGYLNIDIQNNGTNLIGKFISNEGGAILDQFSISKSGTTQPPTPPPSGYHYEPFLDVNDLNDVVTIPDAQKLKLTKFSVAAWFKTTSNFGDEAYIVNKGGHGTDTAGNNMNYGLWMTTSERIQGGFETSSGSDSMVTSPNSYNNGQWHHGVVTFDGSILRLYVDGVQITTLSTSSIPETAGINPLKIGANSRIADNLFTGSIDEVGVWNRTLTTTEITNLKNNGVFPSSGLVYSNSFGISPPSSSGGYHYEPFLDVNDLNDVVTIPDAQKLKLTKFSVAAWFKTTSNFGDEAYIVNKGGHGTDTAGNNMNYGLWMTTSERIQGGFETSSGSDSMVTSPNSYNNGQWHHGVVTFDGSILRLYVDGVQITTLSTSSIPETAGINPLKIGANSRIADNLFTGSIDEVGVWNRTLTTTEITNLKNNGVFPSSGLVYSNLFNLAPNGDEDDDGLLNSWETNGIDSDSNGNIDFILSNANPLHKDLFVEVDYMQFHKPLNQGMIHVINSFGNAPLSNPNGINGINLHVDVDEEITHQPTTSITDLVNIRDSNFGTIAERANANSNNIISAKQLVYHYGLFGHSQPATSSSGMSNGIPAMEFLVSLGAPGWGVDPVTGHVVGSIDQQEGTFMHELGHNLNLHHGGSDDINCKPNYLSVMTYARQFSSLISDRPLDYSKSVIASLNEAILNENNGIGASNPLGLKTVYGPSPVVLTTAGNPEDWNRDGNSIDNPVSSDINDLNFNNCFSSSFQILNGYEDWNNLVYISAPSSGMSLVTNIDTNRSELPASLNDSSLDTVDGFEVMEELTVDDIRQHRLELLRSIEDAINSLPDLEISQLQETLKLKETNDLENLLQSDKLDESIAKLEELKKELTESNITESNSQTGNLLAQQKVLALIENMIKVLEKQK